jgi:hypothetical protein
MKLFSLSLSSSQGKKLQATFKDGEPLKKSEVLCKFLSAFGAWNQLKSCSHDGENKRQKCVCIREPSSLDTIPQIQPAGRSTFAVRCAARDISFSFNQSD